MPRSLLTGSRIRERRTLMGMKQADLARLAEISPSYLNLIEHNRRRIAGKLLTRIARALTVDVEVLTQGAEAAQLDLLGEAAASEPGIAVEMERIDELTGRFPGWSALLAAQQRRIGTLEHRVGSLADRLAHDPFLSASLHEVLSKVSAIQSTASILDETEDLDLVWQQRFHRNLHGDAVKLAAGAALLVEYLESEGEPELGLVSPQEELEAYLNRVRFHVPTLEGAAPDQVDELVAGLVAAAPELTTRGGQDGASVYLHRYRQDSVRMPLEEFAAAAVRESYDPGRLALRFGVDLPSVFRRLASLPDVPGAGRIGLAVCDGSGALTLRKTTEMLPMPRFGAGCALWPLFQALSRPMSPVRAVLEHAARPGQQFLSFAVSQPRYPQGFDGPAVVEAAMLLLPAEFAEPEAAHGPRQVVGTSCRICPAPDCPARREPSIL